MISIMTKALTSMTSEDMLGGDTYSDSGSTHLSLTSNPSNTRGQSLSKYLVSDDSIYTPTPTRESSKMHIDHKNRSNEDLHLLAISAQITEVLYSISDIQTRIFEIQELRHQAVEIPELSESSSKANSISDNSVSAIDQALMDLDSKLEIASKSIGELDNSVNNLDIYSGNESEERSLVTAKRDQVLSEWEGVQKESEELRKELSDDKWLVVFRSVTEQADDMLASLEKILTQCQNFMWQVQRRSIPEAFTSKFAVMEDAPAVDLDQYNALAQNLSAKKTYYVPSIVKIMTMVDKGIRDHSKNGECLRRHADLSARWKNLRERLARVEVQMDNTKRALSSPEGTEATPSITSSSGRPGSSKKTDRERHTKLKNNISPSSSLVSFPTISPFRKLASKVSKTVVSSKSTLTPPKSTVSPRSDSAAQVRSRTSRLFGREPSESLTPEKLRHTHSQSLNSPSASSNSPLRPSVDTPTRSKPRWNSSTKVDEESNSGTVRSRSSLGRPSIGQSLFAVSPSAPPVPPLPPRSPSRSSLASSRPWSPFATTSTVSSQAFSMPDVNRCGTRPVTPSNRPRSRATDYGPLLTPRSRPKTPSQIPTPGPKARSASRTPGGGDDTRRPFSPAASVSGRRSVMTERCMTPSRIPTPRASLGSYPGLPTLTVSRPPSSFGRSIGAQTPEATLKARTLKLPFYRGAHTPRPSLTRGPPSSFRGGSLTPGFDQRFTPSTEPDVVSQYVPNMIDPLDVEVAKTVNGIAHGFLIERVTPPLRAAPPTGQEQKAQYAVSNSLGKKVITCRLVVIKRIGTPGSEAVTKKVMCRVGGGWLDLHMYLLNHQTS